MRRKLLISHLIAAVVITAMVRVVVEWIVLPQLQAMPGGNAEARQLLNDLSVVLLVVALIVAATVFVAFDTLIWRHVTSFTQQLRSVAGAADPSARVATQGGGDLQRLAQPVNRLLGNLQAAQADLQTTERRLALALEATGDGLWDYHADAGTYFSPSYYDILGYPSSSDQLQPENWLKIVHPDDEPPLQELLTQVNRRQTGLLSMELRMQTAEGAWKWVCLRGRVISRMPDGLPNRMIGTLQDITDRKTDEEELRAYAARLVRAKEELERSTKELAAKTAEAEAAKATAEEASRVKSVFLANMSHEIRTPMSAIIGFANLLLDERLPTAERTRCVETIGRQGQHLLSLINNLLDLSKVDADKMTVESIECDPAQIMADVESMTAARAFDRQLPLTIKVASDVPRRVRSDPTRLRQVLLNLVSNAIKFTQTGGIEVELTKWTAPDGAAGLRFTVTDTGIGMDEQQVARLFEPFSQADVSTTRRFGGTGLGLAISKQLVEMMGGAITVHSTAGQGSRFELTITAPVCDAHSTPSRATAAPELRPGLRVLLAEDGEDNCRLIKFYLSHGGVECEVAENGRVAVERALAAEAAGRPFDLVLMDMQMPEMDGCAATLALRRAGLSVPVIALTAHGTEEARRQSFRAGCSEHLVKPLDHATLMSSIAEHTQADGKSKRWTTDSTLTCDPRFMELLNAYVSELPAQVTELIELSDGSASPALRRLLHQIKGAGGGYGLQPISAAATRAQAAFDAGDVNLLGDCVDELVRLMRSVSGYDRAREARSCNSVF
ncbi:MAG TPA: ATP-binding protein [Tepidisphaeraceae bacterium]|jgi:PAS domain S-box-containing protein